MHTRRLVAEQEFYHAIGPKLDGRVFLRTDGLNIVGPVTDEQFRIICAAYANYRAFLANAESPDPVYFI